VLMEIEAELTAIEDAGVAIGEDREEDLAMEAGGWGIPVDIEMVGEAAGGAMRQQIRPPGIGGIGDAHIVGDEIEDEAHATGVEVVDECGEVGFGAELGIESIEIGDVVAVGAAGGGLEQWGSVEVTDSEGVEVWDEGAGMLEGEAAMELEAVGGAERRHGQAAARWAV
jgi:hypothetical protein